MGRAGDLRDRGPGGVPFTALIGSTLTTRRTPRSSERRSPRSERASGFREQSRTLGRTDVLKLVGPANTGHRQPRLPAGPDIWFAMRSGTPPLPNCGFRVLAPARGDRDRGTEPPVRTYQFRGDADPSAGRRCRLRGAVCDRCGCSKPGSSYGLLGSTRTGQRPRPLLTPSIVEHSTTPGNGHALVQVPFRSTGARHARCARALRPFSLIVSVAPPGPVAGGAERFVCMAETVAGACSGDINACAGPPAGPPTVAASAGGPASKSMSVRR